MSPTKKHAEKAGTKKNDAKAIADFPVVGIGSSAGGLEPLRELFESMPSETGMAFVIVAHQHRGHVSMLPDLLSKNTGMPVVEIENGMEIAPNRVYVSTGVPVTLSDNTLIEFDPEDDGRPVLPIDIFFRSLARDRGPRAVCIVLSGTGSDGTLGLKAIKNEGGMALVQESRTARYQGMPESAIGTAQADYVLSVSDMPERLAAYAAAVKNRREGRGEPDEQDMSESALKDIFRLLRARTGHDFSDYKRNTIRRRIERRMNVHQVGDIDTYVRMLKENSREIDTLFKDFLIGVTRFFRDPQTFEALSEGPLRKLLENRPDGGAVRTWIIGCGSGEEAYTAAILLKETAESLDTHFDFQVFATDIDPFAIDAARTGRYPAGIANDVPADKLKRWFEKEDHIYRLSKELRDMVVFATQNVISDPPFSRMDLICCRNMMIYMNGNLQKRIQRILHHALKPDGLLMLGPSETVGTQTDLFEALDSKHKIYRRLADGGAGDIALSLAGKKKAPEKQAEAAPAADEEWPFDDAVRQPLAAAARRILIERYAPPAVIVNPRREIVFVHGRTGPYLEPAGGEQPGTVLTMAREGLRHRLAAALRQAAEKEGIAIERGVRVKSDGDRRRIDLAVMRLGHPKSIAGHFLITFTPAQPEASPSADRPAPAGGDRERADDLEQELRYTRESLQTTVKELETSNEELQSTNEELQSANEELQSTNEELETSKEEMQSLNEELTTVNSELQAKVEELAEANNDIQNLLNSTDIAILFLDEHLRIKRYTKKARDIVHVIDSDIGRPIGDLHFRLSDEAVEETARRVLDSLQEIEREVRSLDGKWHLMRARPYRTTENVISGVAVTFLPIDRFKHREKELRAHWDFYDNLFDTMHEAILVLDENLRVATANERFYEIFRLRRKDTENRKIYDLGNGQWNLPELRRLLDEVLPDNQVFDNFHVKGDFGKAGRIELTLNGRKLRRAAQRPSMIVLAMDMVKKG